MSVDFLQETIAVSQDLGDVRDHLRATSQAKPGEKKSSIMIYHCYS